MPQRSLVQGSLRTSRVEIAAEAKEDYRGRRNGFYTVELHNQKDELIALFRARAVSRDEPLFDESKTDT